MKLSGAAMLLSTVLFPGLVLAQSNVTLYGVADVGFGFIKSDNLASTTAGASRVGGAFVVNSSIQSPSRLGIRGTEDLGGGLAAIFVAEGAWNVDEGTGISAGNGFTFNRRSSVGLQGAFGQVYLGRDYTPTFYQTAANDMGGRGFYGTLAVINNGLQSLSYSNAVFYNTPVWNGLQIRAAAGNATLSGTEYDTSPKGRDRNAEVAALYADRGLTLNASYRFGNADGAAGSVLRRIRQYSFGGGYNFGAFRIQGQVSRSDPSGAAATFSIPTSSANVFDIGAGIRVGAGELLLQYFQVRFQDSYPATGGKPKNQTAMVAYTYPLSKRTNLYVNYGRTNNANGSNIPLSAAATTAGALATATNAQSQAVALGIRHFF